MKIKTNLIEAHIIKRTKKGIKYLIMKRAANQKYPNIWQMVTGKTNAGEKAFDSVIREIKEETDLNVKELYVVPNVNPFYSFEDDSLTLVPVFVAVVNFSETVTISKEHSEFNWVNYKEAKKLLAWPGQKKSVKYIQKYFIKKKSNLNFIRIL